MSKSVVLRFTMKSSSAFSPPSLYAPPVTAPPANTRATRGLRLRDVRSLLWTIVSPMLPPYPPSARPGRRRSAASSHPYYSTPRARSKLILRRRRCQNTHDRANLRRRPDGLRAQRPVGGGDGVRRIDVDPAGGRLETEHRVALRDERRIRRPRDAERTSRLHVPEDRGLEH